MEYHHASDLLYGVFNNDYEDYCHRYDTQSCPDFIKTYQLY